MRKLASVRKIKSLSPIEGADRIELAQIDGWKVVVAKDVNHQVDDLVVYCEIDSYLPIREEFEFLRKSSYVKMPDGSEGFRLKTMRLRGVYSQGLIVPLSVLIDLHPKLEIKIGMDVSEELGIVLYEPPIPDEMKDKVEGVFPSIFKKTEEERIQNNEDIYEELQKELYYATEKLNGVSNTFFYHNGVVGVCSRNYQMKACDDFRWKLLAEYDLENKLKALNRNIAIQGEIIGAVSEEGMKNYYQIKGNQFFVFNIFDIDNYCYLPKNEVSKLASQLGLNLVPVISESFELPSTIDKLLEFVDGKSMVNKNVNREGVVFVCDGKYRKSFKVVSNKFLLKNE